ASGSRSALDVLLPLRPGGTAAPLFCVHPAAGISWVYSGLLRHLDPDRPVHGLQARGLRGGSPSSVTEIAEDYVRQIRAVRPEGPYHLLGWSFGAVVAQAMAVALQAEARRWSCSPSSTDSPPTPPGTPWTVRPPTSRPTPSPNCSPRSASTRPATGDRRS
ncbi:hypothetical protein SF23_13880, partial [Streptomyces sp. MBRL 10]